MGLREFLFSPIKDRRFDFFISAQQSGILSGVEELNRLVDDLKLNADVQVAEGAQLQPGTIVLKGNDAPEQIARAEEMLLGAISKPSGVATAAFEFVKRANGQTKVVCGSWKKVDPVLRPSLRNAIATGGAGIRISNSPFIYLDKNFVRMFGGVVEAVERAKEYDSSRQIVVQLRGEFQPIVEEAHAARDAGADILMIDTGHIEDLRLLESFKDNRDGIQIAFSGGLTLEALPEIIAAKVDIVDVGRSIIDATMLDLRLDIER